MRIVITLLALMLLGAGCADPEQAPESAEAPAETGTAPAIREPPDEVASEEGSVASRLESASTVARVKIALLETPGLDAFTFEPSMRDGQIVLHGDVDTRAQRTTAAQVAREVEGVDEVDNRILVAGREVTPEEEKPSEPQIAEAQPPPEEERSAEASSDQEAASTSEEEQKTTDAENSAQEEDASAEYYTVKSGDSLWMIARQHDTTVDEIKRLNDMQSNSLHPGDRLRIR